VISPASSSSSMSEVEQEEEDVPGELDKAGWSSEEGWMGENLADLAAEAARAEAVWRRRELWRFLFRRGQLGCSSYASMRFTGSCERPGECKEDTHVGTTFTGFAFPSAPPSHAFLETAPSAHLCLRAASRLYCWE
jgi:hypothetical protein